MDLLYFLKKNYNIFLYIRTPLFNNPIFDIIKNNEEIINIMNGEYVNRESFYI